MTGNRRPRMIIATLFGVLFLATVDYQLLIPLLPTIGREFGVSEESLGWLFIGYALAAALFNLFFGPLTDWFGRVIFLRLGLLFFTLIALLTYRVESYSHFFWLRTATGLTAGLLSTCTASFIGDFFPYERRGRVMGIVLSSYFAALVLGVPLAAWVAELWNWRTVFFLSSLLALFMLACCFSFFPKEILSSRSPSRQNYFFVYPQLILRRQTGAAVAVSFGVSGGTLAFLIFISGYLDQAFGLQPVQISWLIATAGVAAAIASPLSGWFSDRLGKRKVFLFANTLLVAPLLALDRLAWGIPLIGLFFLISLCVAFRQTALHTLQTELVGVEERGSFLALRNSFSQLGISLSVFVAGNLYSKAGYGAVTALAALLTLASSVVLYQAVEEPTEKK